MEKTSIANKKETRFEREGQYWLVVGRRDARDLIPSVNRTSTEHRLLSQRMLKVLIFRLFLPFKQRNTIASSMSAPNRVPDSQPR